jgi:uncharacterized protein YcbX
MTGQVSALFRHPVKGFTPERLDSAELVAGHGLANDRIYAVENGPSGFNPDAPAHVSKQKFTVLAAIPAVAKARTRYDDATATLFAQGPDGPPFEGRLDSEDGRAAFAAWLGALIAEDVRGPLRVLPAPGLHRFMDHPLGHVSIINLASVRDLETRMGRPIDPLRFRANIYVEGWEPWVENGWTGRSLMLGWAQARVFAPIVRCAAVEVDPTTGERDMAIPKALFDNYGHMNCGIYIHVTQPGRIIPGDAVTAPDMEAVP